MNNQAERNSTIAFTGRYALNKGRSTTSRSTGRYIPSTTDFIASFYAVLNRWQSETAFSSDPNEIVQHPSFTALVENAETVLPLIISELKNEPSYLVWVLDDAFNERPYAQNEIGDIKRMTEGWILWAERNGVKI